MEPGREDREHTWAKPRSDWSWKPLQWNPAVKTGSTARTTTASGNESRLQWNPAVKTGSTLGDLGDWIKDLIELQWNPAVKTGSTVPPQRGGESVVVAAMEPGREDREHWPPPRRVPPVHTSLQWNPAVKTGSTTGTPRRRPPVSGLQWNPAVKTGSTGATLPGDPTGEIAAMEPGREDREHLTRRAVTHREAHRLLQWNPAVKTGSTSACRAG